MTSMINAEFGSFLRGLPLASSEDALEKGLTRKQAQSKVDPTNVVIWITVDKEHDVNIRLEKLESNGN